MATFLDHYTPVFFCVKCQEPVLGEYAEDDSLTTSCEFCGSTVAEPGDFADAFEVK